MTSADNPYAPPPSFDKAPVGYGTPPDPSSVAAAEVLASPWLRLGAFLLNGVLVVVTLGIGYLVWAMVLWSSGTNPGKKMLGMHLVSAETGQRLDWSGMFLRNFVFGGLVLGLLNMVTLSIISLVDAFMVFGNRNQRLVDRMAKTLVVRT